MATFMRNWPAQLYLSIIPLGVSANLVIHGFRDQDYLSSFYVKRSKVHVPSNFVDILDQEFTSMALKNKRRFRNTNFKVSLIDNLEARTYGTFHFDSGAEFQFPVVSTISDVKELRDKFPNLVDLIKELKIKTKVDTSTFSDAQLQEILMNESARHFFLRREITQAESYSHLVVPSALGSVSVLIGYPVFVTFSKAIGGYPSFLVIGAVALYFTYRLLAAEARLRIFGMDSRVIEEDPSMMEGAARYFKSRLAFGKLLHQQGGELAQAFDDKGNCRSQYVMYSDRLKEIEERLASIAAEEAKKNRVNIRAL